MVRRQGFFYPSRDGKTRLHALVWTGEDPPGGVVQIAHGICEYAARYDHLARWLAQRGFVVVGNDHLGHGQSLESPEKQGFFAQREGWRIVTDDLEFLRQQTVRRYPGLPYFFLGHSMGSFLVRTHLIRYPGRVTGAALCGTGHQDPRLLDLGWRLTDRLCRLRGPLYRSPQVQALMFGSFNRGFRPNRTDFDWVCGSQAVVDAYIQDENCQFLPTVGLCRDMMEGLRFITDPENLTRMDRTTPVLFLSGALDPVGEAGAGVERAYQRFLFAGCADVERKLYPNGRHELLNEDFRERVYADLLRWMEKRMGK